MEAATQAAVDAALMLADPEIREELSKRDPNFAAQYAEEQREKVAVVFRQQNPAYLGTDRNFTMIVQTMAVLH